MVPFGALAAITLTMLLASNHGPLAASAISTSAAKVLASLVNFTEGRACRPTSWVIRTVASAAADILEIPFTHDGDNSCAVATTSFSEAPPDASVAAITAPSTIGALQTMIFCA